jgi:hypothetical protein
MGTAVMMDARTIDQAKAEAVRLLGLAYLPQPVRQPDGTTLHLCLAGRLARGQDKLAIARRAGDAKSVATLEGALKHLRTLTEQAHSAAENAASTWAAMAAAQGLSVDPVSIYPAPCTCAECVAQANYQGHQSARDIYTTVLYDLVAPNSWTTPPVIDLMRRARAGDEEARRQIWRYLDRILDAGNLYMAACDAASVSPNWRLALYPGEGNE